VAENVTPEIIHVSTRWLAWRRLRQSRMLRGLPHLLPDAVRRAWLGLTTIQLRRSDVDTTAAREFLRIVQQPQTAALSRITKKEFPEWNIRS
jgi:hypothetical protein